MDTIFTDYVIYYLPTIEAFISFLKFHVLCTVDRVSATTTCGCFSREFFTAMLHIGMYICFFYFFLFTISGLYMMQICEDIPQVLDSDVPGLSDRPIKIFLPRFYHVR